MDKDLSILVAEDNEADAILLRNAFGAVAVKTRVHVVRDGQQAIDYLSGVGRYEDRKNYPFPKVLFTDLTMPRATGFDVLRWMRDYPERAVTPRIVLSSSNLPKDVRMAYELGANAYMVKPTRFEDLKELVNRAYRFWSCCAKPEADFTNAE